MNRSKSCPWNWKTRVACVTFEQTTLCSEVQENFNNLRTQLVYLGKKKGIYFLKCLLSIL